jgi:uncharacterized membrane protein
MTVAAIGRLLREAQALLVSTSLMGIVIALSIGLLAMHLIHAGYRKQLVAWPVMLIGGLCISSLTLVSNSTFDWQGLQVSVMLFALVMGMYLVLRLFSTDTTAQIDMDDQSM